jgi:signal transduction histidine kinase
MNGLYQLVPSILPNLVTAAFLAVLWAYAWRHRSVPGAISFLVLIGSAIVTALASSAEWMAVDATVKFAWFTLSNIVGLLGVTAAFCFALDYAYPGRWMTRRNLAALSIPIVASALLAFTNDQHHLLWTGFQVDDRVHPSNAPLSTAILAYGIFLLMLNTIVLAGLFIRSPLHRWPIGLIVAGGLVSRVVVSLHLTGVIEHAVIDPVVLACGFSGLMFAIALFGFQMFDIVPLARDMVIERMRDGMLVLDGRNRLVEMNPAARQSLGEQAAQVVQTDLAPVLYDAPDSRWPGAYHAFEARTGQGYRRYEARLSQLADVRGLLRGRLVLLHDVTGGRLAQERLLQQQRALGVLQERSRVARELHDGLGQVLVYARMQAEAARAVLPRGRSGEADECLAGIIEAAENARANARADPQQPDAASVDETAAQPGCLAALAQLLNGFAARYGIATQLNAPPSWADETVKPAALVLLLSIVQEALSNAAKHARCNEVRVSLRAQDGTLHVAIEDDGVGFDPAQAPRRDRVTFGLDLMRERAMDLHGALKVDSAPGRGTRVSIQVPWPAP